MVDIVTGQNAHLYTQALRQMYRIRHRVYVEQLGWKELRKPDGLERDQFDNANAIYLLMFDDEGFVIGGLRYVPTNVPHLLSDVFPKACNLTGVIRGDRILEGARIFFDEERIPADKLQYIKGLFHVASNEFLVRTKVEAVTGFTHMNWISKMVREGLDIRPIGDPVEFDGVAYVPIINYVSEQAYERLRKAFGVKGSLLRYLGPVPVDQTVITHNRPEAIADLH